MKTIKFQIVALISSISAVSAFTCTNTVGRSTALFSSTEAVPDATPAPVPEAAVAPAVPEAAAAPAVPEATAVAAPAPASASTENKQPKYGKELELPGTYVRCGRCATSFALTLDELGGGKGLRVECSVCAHSWFQSCDRLFNLNDGRELVPLPQVDLERIASNIAKGRDPDFVGDTKFFVGNLDFGVEESDVRKIFADIGEVGDVALVTGPDGRSRGFAFVTMMDDEVKDECLKLDGLEMKGRNINVKIPN
jgi:predicted Zn finger-like uncharacterized protein